MFVRVVIPLLEVAASLFRYPIRWVLLGALDGAEAVARRFR